MKKNLLAITCLTLSVILLSDLSYPFRHPAVRLRRKEEVSSGRKDHRSPDGNQRTHLNRSPDLCPGTNHRAHASTDNHPYPGTHDSADAHTHICTDACRHPCSVPSPSWTSQGHQGSHG